MLNCVTLMGRLVADPELKTTTSGKEVCSFTVAVDRSYSPDGQKKSDFINIVAWESGARFVCNYFKKGQLIAIQGAIQTRAYQTQKGEKRTAFEVVARELSFCSSKNEGSAKKTEPEKTEPEGINGYYSNATAADFSEICIDDEDYVEV